MKFSELDDRLYPGSPDHSSSLDEWYGVVRHEEIDRLAVGDLARAVRQQLFMRHVLPRVIELLSRDLMAGEDYDGQLLRAVCMIDGKGMDPYTIDAVRELQAELLPLLTRAVELPGASEDLRRAAVKFRQLLLAWW